MRFYLLLSALFLVFWGEASAQVCNGALGDPVVNETFGAGVAPFGHDLGDTTSYAYTPSACPIDGYYSIVHSVGDCFSNSWHYLSGDHTGDPNGYMMLVNASPAPGLFFTYPVHGLCSGSTYEFGAWIIGLTKQANCGGNPKLANIAFTIETTTGTVLATYTTGDIAVTPAPQWGQYKLYFKTPVGVTDIVLKMSNANTLPGTCGNDLAIDDITFRPCGPIVSADFNSSNSSVPAELCAGYTGNFTINASLDASTYTNAAYQWQFNGGAGWANIAGANQTSYTIQFNNAQIGAYQYRLAVAEAANINSTTCRVVSNGLTVNVTAVPAASASTVNALVCYSDTIKLLGGGGATYAWTGPNGYTSNVQNPLIGNVTQPMAGTYTVTATSAAGCFSSASVNISVYPAFTVKAGKDTTICKGQTVALNASGAVKYSWSPTAGLSDPAIANPIASPTDITTYTVTGTSVNGCTNTATVTINVPKAATASAGPDKAIFLGQRVQLNGAITGSNLTYSWAPSAMLANALSLSPTANPADDITYTLTVSDACNTVTSSVFLKVFKSIVIPTAFSPNGDSINDTWSIPALVAFPQNLVHIYDRNGLVIYTSTGYSKAWDGTYKGRFLPLGTYYYVIDLKNSMPLLSGAVTIIR
jgi:gliding motility-associated-like protein